MKKPNINYASTDFQFHPNNLKLFIKRNEKESYLKLSLPLILTFWFPFMISFSTFGPNQDVFWKAFSLLPDKGYVGVPNKNFTNTSSYPDRNHTDKVLLENNNSRVYNDTTYYENTLEEELEGNPLQETNPGEDLFWKILGYSEFICERQIEDIYLENKQEDDSQTGQARLTYLNLNEFNTITKQDNGLNGAANGLINITHRLEPDGTEYNYAAASKGAKVVAHDKEAKGANNILTGDHDMYLRNPCSVSDKFVVIELAEETLVDAITIANFEHHSSNFKQFELSGSLVFPAETWYELGTFDAENVKHRQFFKLPEPKWARYIMLRLITHYGTEFYCTLSVFEAYGVDAIEKMLEDLIMASSGESTDGKSSNPNRTVAPALWGASGYKKPDGDIDIKVPETVKKGTGRIHGDAVLKILMQKIRLLENNLMLLEENVDEMNKIQDDVLSHLDKEVVKYSGLVEETRSEIKGFWPWKETMEKEIAGLESWKDSVSFLLESVMKENIMLRQDLEKIARDEESIDKTEYALLCATLSFTVVVASKILLGRFSNSSGDSPDRKVQKSTGGWKALVFACIITTAVTLTFC